MDLKPPSESELELMLLEHAHRFPEKASVTVPGDGGTPVRLPLLVGNPSGACEMPDGKKPSEAWAGMMSAALGLREEPVGLGMAVLEDCVLWPERANLAAMVARWPALPGVVSKNIETKIAADDKCMVTPGTDDAPPALIAAALTDRAVWRYLRPRGEEYTIAIEPPTSAVWGLFKKDVQKRTSNPWPTMVDLIRATVKACCRTDGSAVAIADVLRRFPGLGPVLVGAVGVLVGAGAEFELGGW